MHNHDANMHLLISCLCVQIVHGLSSQNAINQGRFSLCNVGNMSNEITEEVRSRRECAKLCLNRCGLGFNIRQRSVNVYDCEILDKFVEDCDPAITYKEAYTLTYIPGKPFQIYLMYQNYIYIRQNDCSPTE